MRSKSTTAMGREHEEYVCEVFKWDNAKRSLSSGASFHAPVDITSNTFVIECEATENNGHSALRALWQEVVGKQHSGKLPAIAIRFRDPINGDHIDLLVTELHEASEAHHDSRIKR